MTSRGGGARWQGERGLAAGLARSSRELAGRDMFLRHAARTPCPRWAGAPPHAAPASARRRRSGRSPYRAVVLDASGVLLPAPHRTAADWEARNCIPAGTIQRAVTSGGENSPSLKYSRGELTTVEFLQELGQQCFEIANVCVPVDSFLSNLIRREMIKQLPTMAEAVQCIRAEGLKTALLSNSFRLSNGESFLPLDQQHFDVVVEAHREGKCKPDPRIYELCLERLGVRPQESIFLDSSSQSLQTAARLDIKTVKVDDLEVALKELETHLGFPLQGFVPYTCSVRATVEIPKDRLQKYLENVFSEQATGPLVLRQFGRGWAARTYYVRFGDRSLVLKKELPEGQLPPGPAVGREYRVLKALSEAGVPVPTVLALCEDSSTLGAPFYLMEHCAGHIYSDASLAALLPSQRGAAYAAMSQALAKIHSVDLGAARLEDYGERGNYIQQQVDSWTKQYRAVETDVIPAMERLIKWLPLHFPDSQKVTVVHGDFRVDNLVFHPERPEVLAVLGWKLSTLGDPISDLANNCMAFFLPPHFNAPRGSARWGLGHLGVPTAEEYCQMYCGHRGVERPENFHFYMAFAFFRLAAVLQGRYKRSLAGRPAPGESRPEDAELVADLAWDFAIKEGFRVFESLPAAKPCARRYSTWARQGPFLSRSCGTWPCPGAASVPQVPPLTSLSSFLGMAQGLYCKLERISDVQGSFLISQPTWTLRPLLDLQAGCQSQSSVSDADWAGRGSG
ncbi:acyl-CoA dehydrogenase family member 10 isoform X4 [Cygnus olor]|uniref:acyl-CoA dehydrogenase family member 10 isoform X4 n=1 Tax=Cygnus olor TaxID=8869 RepID=UPI001ADEBE9A|nr:acyl-CoA dehydrogenase family member 10 isoform X4 [Cygnus olor]XP_040432402.1 acyl-CoA dehydrogenase family member 10 isoform X4 [Cygnus olor]